MKIYLFFELIILFIIYIFKIIIKNEVILDCLTICPALFTSLYLTITQKLIPKTNKVFYVILLLSVFGDISFVYSIPVFGIFFFLFIQTLYFSYLKNIPYVYSIIFNIINIILCLILRDKIMIIEGLIYSLISFYNFYKSTTYLFNKKISLKLYLSFLFLLLCDLSLGIIYFEKTYSSTLFITNLCFCLEWLFYTLFQLTLTKYIFDKK